MNEKGAGNQLPCGERGHITTETIRIQNPPHNWGTDYRELSQVKEKAGLELKAIDEMSVTEHRWYKYECSMWKYFIVAVCLRIIIIKSWGTKVGHLHLQRTEGKYSDSRFMWKSLRYSAPSPQPPSPTNEFLVLRSPAWKLSLLMSLWSSPPQASESTAPMVTGLLQNHSTFWNCPWFCH